MRPAGLRERVGRAPTTAAARRARRAREQVASGRRDHLGAREAVEEPEPDDRAGSRAISCAVRTRCPRARRSRRRPGARTAPAPPGTRRTRAPPAISSTTSTRRAAVGLAHARPRGPRASTSTRRVGAQLERQLALVLGSRRWRSRAPRPSGGRAARRASPTPLDAPMHDDRLPGGQPRATCGTGARRSGPGSAAPARCRRRRRRGSGTRAPPARSRTRRSRRSRTIATTRSPVSSRDARDLGAGHERQLVARRGRRSRARGCRRS